MFQTHAHQLTIWHLPDDSLKFFIMIICCFRPKCLQPYSKNILSPRKQPLLFLEFKALPDFLDFFDPFMQPTFQSKIFCKKSVTFDETCYITHYPLDFFLAATIFLPYSVNTGVSARLHEHWNDFSSGSAA